MRTCRPFWFVVLSLAAAVGHAALVPIEADTYVRGGTKADTNFGASSAVWVRQGGPRFTLIQFDTAGLAGTASAATLSLRLLTLNNPGTFDVHRLLEPWDEGTVTFNTTPAFDPIVAGTSTLSAADVGNVVNVDVLPAFEAWLTGAPNHGLILVNVDGVNAKFSSREGTLAPALDVELQPVPPQIATVASVGGDYASPLDAMANVDTGDAWCGTPSADNPCLVDIGPGVFDLGADVLFMRSHVSVRGAGPDVTTLRSTVRVVETASHLALSSLRVETSSTTTSAVSVNADSEVRVVDLDIDASRSGIIIQSSDEVIVRRTSVRVSGPNFFNTGMFVVAATDVRLEQMDIEVSGDDNGALGLQVATQAEVVADQLRIRASGPGRVAQGILINGASLALQNAQVSAVGGSAVTQGVRLFNSQVSAFAFVVTNSQISAEPGGTSSGIANDSGFTNNVVLINRSEISGATNSIRAANRGVFRIGASQLIGPVLGSSFTCVGAYSGNFTPLGISCL